MNKHPQVGGESAPPRDLEDQIALDLASTLADDPEPPDLAPGPPDSDEPYPDWSAETTRVVSGPLGVRAKYPGQRFASWKDAERSANERFRVVKFWCFANRWYARIKRDGPVA